MSSSLVGTGPSGTSLTRRLFEVVLALGAATSTGLALLLLGGIAVKYQVAMVAGALIGGAVLLHRDRRILLVVLWVCVMPLGLEKVVDSGTSIGPEFLTQFVVFNAADVLLFLLGTVLLFEWLQTGLCPLVGSPLLTAWSLILGWSVVSYAIHGLIIGDGLVNVAPLSILTEFRTLLFFVLLQSSIRNRGELIAVVAALGITLLLQSLVVMASYTSGEVFNLARLLGESVKSNSFGGGAETVSRASGTIGYINQQAAYHAFCTLPLAALLALRNPLFRNGALAVICLSFLAIILTFSRGAWLASAVALVQVLFLFVYRREVTSGGWLKGGLLALAGCIALGVLSHPILERLSRDGDDGATGSRLRMNALALDLFKDHPLMGVGPGEYVEAGYKLEPNNYRYLDWVAPGDAPTVPGVGRLEVALGVTVTRSAIVPLAVHNRYLLSLSELGVPGLILWLALFWIIVRSTWRCSRARDPFYRFLGIAGTGAATGLLVYSMVDLFADDKSLQILFLMPVLFSVAERHVRGNGAVTVSRPGPGSGDIAGERHHLYA